eukprot:gene13255-9496_t
MSGDKLWVQLEGSTSLVFVRTGEDVFVDDKAVVTVYAIKLALKKELPRKLDPIPLQDIRATSRVDGPEKRVTLKTPAIETILCVRDAVKGVESEVSCSVEQALLQVVSTVYAESFEDPQFHSLVLQRDAPTKSVFLRIGYGIGVTLRVTWRGYLAVEAPASPFFISHTNGSTCGSVSSVDPSLAPTLLRVSFQRRRFRRGVSSLHHGEVLTALRPITMWQGERRRTDAFLKLYTVECADNASAQAVDKLHRLDMKMRQFPQLQSVEGFVPSDVWYTAFQIALVSPFVGERDATSDDLLQSATARAVAAPLLAMAKMGLLFSSLELGHIRVAVDGSRPTLVGLDHCEILGEPVQSGRDLLDLLGRSPASQFLVEHGGLADALSELS